MDIYAYAENGMIADCADYYDQESGLVYHVAAYNQARRFGLPTLGIGVSDIMTGEFLGYAQKMDESKEPIQEQESVPVNQNDDVTNIFILESGLGYAPEDIQQWFERNPEFRISAVCKNSIVFAPVGSNNCSEWITVNGTIVTNDPHQWTDLAHCVDKEGFPKYIAVRCNGGNVNSDNGGYSVCCWKTRTEERAA